MADSPDYDVFNFDRYLDPEYEDPYAASQANPFEKPQQGGAQGGLGDLSKLPDPFELAARQFDPRPDYRADPALWGKHRLGEFYWSKQDEILKSLNDNRYTAVKSCHDAGKSFIAARAAAKWIDEHEAGEAFVVSTAPTSAQVSAILWREIGRAHRKGALAGTITTAGYPQWKLGGELVGYGRKPADYSQSAFQGIHARYVLVIIDEACGVTESLFNSVDALVTNAHARVLAIGNPDDPTSHFASVCKPDSGWNVIRIDGLDTPNFTQEAVEWLDCPQCVAQGRTTPLLAQLFAEEKKPYSTEHVPESLRDMLLSPLWVEERLHRWVGNPTEERTLSELGEQSALFTAKVRGLFPTNSAEGVVPLGWVEAAMARWDQWVADGRPPLPVNERHILGVDVARGGEDANVIAFREAHIVKEVKRFRNADTMETVAQVSSMLSDRAGSQAIIDSIGVGAGVLDRLRQMGKSAVGFNAAEGSGDRKDRAGEFRFANKRAAAWWNMRELLDPSRGSIIMLPSSEALKADLTVPKWKVITGGKIQVESKDDLRKRLGRSTDEGDAVVMSFWSGHGTVDAVEAGAVSWWSESDGSVVRWGYDGETADSTW